MAFMAWNDKLKRLIIKGKEKKSGTGNVFLERLAPLSLPALSNKNQFVVYGFISIWL